MCFTVERALSKFSKWPKKGSETDWTKMGRGLCLRPMGPQCCDVLVASSLLLMVFLFLAITSHPHYSHHFCGFYLSYPSSCFSFSLLTHISATAPSLLLWGQVSLDSKKQCDPLLVSRPVICLLNCSTWGWSHFCSILGLSLVTFGFVGILESWRCQLPACWGHYWSKLLLDISRLNIKVKWQQTHAPCLTYDLQMTLRKLRLFCLFSSLYEHLKYLHPQTKLGFARNI